MIIEIGANLMWTLIGIAAVPLVFFIVLVLAALGSS